MMEKKGDGSSSRQEYLDLKGDGSSSRQEYLDLIFQVIRENEHFLYENSEDLCSEIVELMNDAIDYMKEGTIAEDYVKYSVLYFLWNLGWRSNHW
jgi:hypothetical protein